MVDLRGDVESALCAEHVASHGAEVTIATPFMSFGPHLGFTHVNDVLRRLYGLGCALRAEHGRSAGTAAGEAVTRHIHTRQVQERRFEAIVAGAPGRSDTSLAAAVERVRRAPAPGGRRGRPTNGAARIPRGRRRREGGMREPGHRGDDVRRHARRGCATTAGRRRGRVHGCEGHRPRAARALGAHGALPARARRPPRRPRRDRDAELHGVRGGAVRLSRFSAPWS